MGISIMQAERIADSTLNVGGATFNQKGLVNRNSGYQVGVFGFGREVRIADNSRTDVVNAILQFAHDKGHLFDSGFDMGTWINDGTLYLDVTRHYVDRESALAYGRDGGELAIWDWANSAEVPCK